MMSRNFKIREPDWSAALWARVKRMFGGLDTRVTTLEQSGGEANVINSISFNGNNVPPDANKNVAIVESDPTVPSWAKASTKPAYSASEVGAKAVQTPVSDPTASGTSVTFIDGITQNAQGVIAPTKKTVKTMTGATSGAAGAAGLVPQPSAGDDGKYLKGDGTWGTPGGGGEMNVIESISLNGTNVPPDGNKNVALTVPTKTSDLTNDGDGTYRFATLDDLPSGGGNPDVVLDGIMSLTSILAAIGGMDLFETRTFYANGSVMLTLSERKISMSVMGVLVREFPTTDYKYSYIAADSGSGAHVYIGHIVIDAQQSTVTATVYSLMGTAL